MILATAMITHICIHVYALKPNGNWSSSNIVETYFVIETLLYTWQIINLANLVPNLIISTALKCAANFNYINSHCFETLTKFMFTDLCFISVQFTRLFAVFLFVSTRPTAHINSFHRIVPLEYSAPSVTPMLLNSIPQIYQDARHLLENTQ